MLANSDVKCHTATTQPLINSNQFDLKKKWSIMMSKLDQTQWNQIVFSDEKTLQNFNNGKVKVYRKRCELSENHIYKKTLNRFKINLFGYITRRGLGNLYVFDDVLNSEKYINYLHYDVFPDVIEDVGPSFVWQQDGASSHVSKLSLDYFEKVHANLLIWPPTCPDFNIMENVWSLFQKNVNQMIFKEVLPKSRADLIEYAFRSWFLIGDAFVVKLFNSLPSRVSKFKSI